jgi:hypothetical protein
MPTLCTASCKSGLATSLWPSRARACAHGTPCGCSISTQYSGEDLTTGLLADPDASCRVLHGGDTPESLQHSLSLQAKAIKRALAVRRRYTASSKSPTTRAATGRRPARRRDALVNQYHPMAQTPVIVCTAACAHALEIAGGPVWTCTPRYPQGSMQGLLRGKCGSVGDTRRAACPHRLKNGRARARWCLSAPRANHSLPWPSRSF